MNYFEFYELPISLQVDADELKSYFYRKSKEYHPDFYTLAPPEEQQRALELSTLNNEAYAILKDEDRRLKYVLDLKNALAEEGKNQLPQDFLMEMMDINESLMEVEMEGDPVQREQVIGNIALLEADLQEEVAHLIAHFDADKVTDAELSALRDFYLKRRYLLRIKENLNNFAAP